MTSFFQYPFGPYRILQIPILTDNYVYIICSEEHNYVVDPGRVEALNTVLEKEQLRPTAIINTHHHWDHTDGNLEFIKKWQCPVYGFEQDAHRIPGITNQLSAGDTVQLGPLSAEVLFLPGHTQGLIAYYFKQQKWLFSGDVLFSLGCGRLFEGTAEQMYNSLNRLRQLPEDTWVFCTHEYTEANLKFSQSILPEDKAIKEAESKITNLRSQNKPTVPMPLGQELRSNLFLRWDDPTLREKLGMQESEDWEVFAEIRKRKDKF